MLNDNISRELQGHFERMHEESTARINAEEHARVWRTRRRRAMLAAVLFACFLGGIYIGVTL